MSTTVAGFSVRREVDGPAAFAVVDLDGRPVPELGAFLRDLAERGRSAYTQRAYALGLADFFGWLRAGGLAVEAVDRSVVSTYVENFRTGAKAGATRVDVARIGRVDGRTRKPAPALERQPATVNHRLAVLASFFAFVIGRDRERGAGSWLGAENPVPRAGGAMEGSHGMPGRDAPRRGRRGELRQRVPRRLPRHLEPGLAEELIEAARSWRDKALVMLLWRTGQRIGDWSEAHGRHGVLGMALADLDRRTGMAAERAGSSPGGQGKAVPVEETAVQLSLAVATAENPQGATRRRTRDRLGVLRAGAPKATSKVGMAPPATMEEVANRLTSALLKVASNKGAPGPDGQTVEALLEQWPTVCPGCRPTCWLGATSGAIRRR